MKSYKQYEKVSIGGSDSAALELRFRDKVAPLYFNEDGEYMAYIVDADAEIASHYKIVAEGHEALNVYDDFGLIFKTTGDVIRVYRAGNFGCIIQVIE